MKRIELIAAIVLGYAGFAATALAAASQNVSSPSMNNTGFFIGIGPGYNSVKVDGHLSGTLDAVSGVPPLGIFSGDGGSYSRTRHPISPEVQIGYLQHYQCTDWLWGVKFLYQYLNTEKSNNVDLNYANSTTADLVTANVKTAVNHELATLLFVGKTFYQGFVYLGAGPSLLGVENRVENLDDTNSGLYIGNMPGFSHQENWVWGWAAQAGATYYFNPTLFADLNYTYAETRHYSSNNSGAFSQSVNGGLNAGNISLDTSKRITTQSVMLSINKVFTY